MKDAHLLRVLAAFFAAALLASPALAQGTAADYARANGLRAKYEDLAVNVPGAASWIEKTTRFWYRRSVKSGHEFLVFDADTRQKRPAFDHEKLAASLSKATSSKYTAVTLPFTSVAFADEERALDVTVDGAPWKCSLADYACKKDESEARRTFNLFSPRRPDDPRPRVSPDGKWEAVINNYNVAVRPAGTQKLAPLSTDGSEGNAYESAFIVWSPDSKKIAAYHQVYRIIEVDATTGTPRAVISEEPKTFFNYRTANGSLSDSGKKYSYDVADRGEIVWMSERDGWNHLYLVDGATGRIKNQITKGNWVVRGVVKVDDERRQVWFSAGGMYPGKDPYFLYYYRINFDGSGLTRLTGDADANHNGSFSSDMKYFVDTYSRIDTAPVSELRLVDDGSFVTEIERGDISGLVKSAWRAPEVFTSAGRDGKTDIWGVIVRPSNFDPSRKYPAIENIYAGPQGSFVPNGEHKRFDFFVRELLGVRPPAWTKADAQASTTEREE